MVSLLYNADYNYLHSDAGECVGANLTRCSDGQCLHKELKCDGYPQCKDHDDEEQCGKLGKNKYMPCFSSHK